LENVITIIKDYNNVFHLNEGAGIEIKENGDFIEARKFIISMKELKFSKEFYIVIKNKKFDNGFKDLETYTSFVIFKDENVIKYVEKELNIMLPNNISEQEIVRTDILFNIKRFSMRYNKSISFKENCILYTLSLNNLDYFHSLNGLMTFLVQHNIKLKQLISERNEVLLWLEKEIIINMPNSQNIDFVIDILRGKLKIDNLIKYMIFNNIFKDYKESDKETIGKPVEVCFIEYKLSQENLLCLIKQYNLYLAEIDILVLRKQKNLSLFDEDNDFMYVVNKISGVLQVEYDVLIKRINNMISDKLDLNFDEVQSYINLMIDKFEPLFELEADKKNYLINLKRLMYKLKIMLDSKVDFSTLDEWIYYYITTYLTVNNDLIKDDNVFRLIEDLRIDENIKDSFINRTKNKVDEVNSNYEKYLYNNYNKLLDRKDILFNSFRTVTENYSNDKIVVIVIDCLRWDIWNIIKNILENYGYSQMNQNCAVVSMIPSVTSISRLSLFAVNKYKNIISEKLNKTLPFNVNDEEKHMKRYFHNKKIVFGNGGKNTFNEIIEKEADLYTFIFTDGDEVFHGLKDINEDVISAMFKLQLENIINKIEQKFNDDITLVIATDHGSININQSKVISLDHAIKNYFEHYNIKYDIHGKYVKIFSEQEVSKSIYDEMNDYFTSQGEWHVIRKDNMDNFALPNKDEKHNILFYLIAKYGFHIGGIRGSNVHGGLSMNETIIPFVVMKKKHSEIKRLIIDISGELVTNTISKISITVINENNFDVKNLRLSMHPLYFEKVIDFISSHEKVIFEENIIPSIEGIIINKMESTYMKMGNIIKEKYELKLEVKANIKTRISDSVKKSRSLDL